MGYDAGTGVAQAYDNLNAVWEQLKNLDNNLDAKDYQVNVSDSVGSLNGRTVTVCSANESPQIGSFAKPLREFVRTCFEKLYPAGGEALDKLVDDFLQKKTKLEDRQIVLDRAQGRGLVDSLAQARVREVKADDLEILKTEIDNLAAAHPELKELATGLGKAFEAVRKSTEKLADKTGKELAASWQQTLDRAPQAKRNDKKEFVEVASDACMEASSELMDFINAVHDTLKDEMLTEQMEALLDKLEEKSGELSTYSRDITLLADDMAAIAKSKGNEGTAELNKAFDAFTTGNAIRQDRLDTIASKLDGISDKVRTLMSREAQDDKVEQGTAKADVERIKGEVDQLVHTLGERASEESRGLTHLRNRAKEVASALEKWVRREPSAVAQYENLRSKGVLRSVFDGEFDTDFYLYCRKNGVTEEQLDFDFAATRLESRSRLGSGGFNTVYKYGYRKVGCASDNETGVFKFDSDAVEMYRDDYHRKFYGYNAKTYVSRNVNFAAWKVANNWLGAGGAVVRSSVSYANVKYVNKEDGTSVTKKEFGIVMDKAPGCTLNSVNAIKGHKNQIKSLTQRQKWRAASEMMLQGNDLDWCDWLTGQQDRHHGNIMLDVDGFGGEAHVTLTGIDNDASFGFNRVGLNKFRLSEKQAEWFVNAANDLRTDRYGDQRWPEIDKKTWEDLKACKAFTKDEETGQWTVDRLKFPKEFAKMFYGAVRLNSARRPSFITKETLAKLDDVKRRIEEHKSGNGPDPFEADFGDYLPEPALAAMRLRFDEMYDYAQKLKKDGKVFSASDLRAAGRGLETPENELAAENEFKKLLTVAYANRAELSKILTDEVGVDDSYDLGYSILLKLDFFKSGNARSLHNEVVGVSGQQ